jgi:hypothetical protein
MNESIFMHGWATILGFLVTIAIVVTALGLLLGLLKPADALKRIGSLLGIGLLLMLVPGEIANLLLNMSLWQKIALALVGLIILWARRRRRQDPRK